MNDMKNRKSPSGSSPGKSLPDESVGTSLKVFRSYLQIDNNHHGSVDASRITSSECFRDWVATRKHGVKFPEKAFQRALTAHVTGLDGRTPFTSEEEQAILKVLRIKRVWPCFEGKKVQYGKQGFRALGFHERLNVGVPRKSLSNKRAKIWTKEQLDSGSTKVNSSHISDSAAGRSKSPLESGSTERNEDGDGLSGNDTSGHSDEEGNSSNPTLNDSASITSISSSNSPAEDTIRTLVRTGPRSSKQRVIAENQNSFSTSSIVQTTTQEQSTVFQYEVSAVIGLAQRFKGYTRLWPIIFGFTRMRFLGRGLVEQPTMEKATALMQRIKAIHPDTYTIFHDFASSNFSDRLILQDDTSLEMFGGISRVHGGFRGKRFLLHDIVTVTKTTVSAFSHPGQEFHMRIRVILGVGKLASEVAMIEGGDEKQVETVWVDVYMSLDPETNLIIERGRTIAKADPVSVLEVALGRGETLYNSTW